MDPPKPEPKRVRPSHNRVALVLVHGLFVMRPCTSLSRTSRPPHTPSQGDSGPLAPHDQQPQPYLNHP